MKIELVSQLNLRDIIFNRIWYRDNTFYYYKVNNINQYKPSKSIYYSYVEKHDVTIGNNLKSFVRIRYE